MEIQAISSATATLAQSQTTNESASTSKVSQSAAPKPVRTPPPPVGGAKPVAPSSGDSSGSSVKKIYDKQDANQDGIVSYQEELLYTLKHPPEETEEQPTVSASQLQAGLNAYQQNSLLKT
jgi:hypothetical protein